MGVHALLSHFSNEQALEVTIWRDGDEFYQRYSRGKPVTALTRRQLPDEVHARRGTHIKFWPDKEGSILCLFPYLFSLIAHHCIT